MVVTNIEDFDSFLDQINAATADELQPLLDKYFESELYSKHVAESEVPKSSKREINPLQAGFESELENYFANQ